MVAVTFVHEIIGVINTCQIAITVSLDSNTNCHTYKMASSPADSWSKLRETRRRLEFCWNEELDWRPFPQTLREVICIDM